MTPPEPSGHRYDDGFFDYISVGSRRSARRIIAELIALLPVTSVVDIGCGQGAWCAEWLSAGVPEVLGIDGDYVDQDTLVIPAGSFRVHDLSRPFDLGRRFDLVVSLEVAEHVPESAAATFVENLVRHGNLVMFSAAVPGQGGEFHVNEQPYGYWRTHFQAHGYACFDAIRPRIRENGSVEPWYRYNTLLFASEAAANGLPPRIVDTLLPADVPVPEFAPVSWRLRNATLRRMPRPLIEGLARLKHASYRWARSSAKGERRT